MFCCKECQHLWMKQNGPVGPEPDPMVRKSLNLDKDFWDEFDRDRKRKRSGPVSAWKPSEGSGARSRPGRERAGQYRMRMSAESPWSRYRLQIDLDCPPEVLESVVRMLTDTLDTTLKRETGSNPLTTHVMYAGKCLVCGLSEDAIRAHERNCA